MSVNSFILYNLNCNFCTFTWAVNLWRKVITILRNSYWLKHRPTVLSFVSSLLKVWDDMTTKYSSPVNLPPASSSAKENRCEGSSVSLPLTRHLMWSAAVVAVGAICCSPPWDVLPSTSELQPAHLPNCPCPPLTTFSTTDWRSLSC